jgi:hypothetical protein
MDRRTEGRIGREIEKEEEGIEIVGREGEK